MLALEMSAWEGRHLSINRMVLSALVGTKVLAEAPGKPSHGSLSHFPELLCRVPSPHTMLFMVINKDIFVTYQGWNFVSWGGGVKKETDRQTETGNDRDRMTALRGESKKPKINK